MRVGYAPYAGLLSNNIGFSDTLKKKKKKLFYGAGVTLLLTARDSQAHQYVFY